MSNILKIAGAGVSAAAEDTDANFNQTVLLLHGDGTNGAQNNTFLDSSSNNFTVTRSGNVTQGSFSPFGRTSGNLDDVYDPAVNGGSGYFDGTGDYLSISDSTAFNMGSGDFTCECWIYTTNAAATSAYITTAETTDFQGFFLGQDGGSFFFLADSGSSPWNVSISGGTVVANTWTHVAGVRNGNVFTLYINGTSVGTTTQSITLGNSNNKIVIGGRTIGSQYFAGYISNARVVKGTAVYTSAFTPSTSLLTAVSGTSLLLNFTNAGIFDNTGKNNLETVGNAQVDTSTKKFGTGSLEFDGTGDYLLLPNTDNFAFGTGDFTLEFFLYANNVSGVKLLFDVRTSVTQVTPALFLDDDEIKLTVNGTVRITSGTISSGTFYHVAVCRSGSSTKMFLDGTQTGSTYTDTNNYLCPGPLNIGRYPVGNNLFHNGFIDELRITKAARYTTTFTPPTQAFPNL